MNAVKYACFAPREGRFVRVEAKKDDENIILSIKNSFVPGKSARTTRVGNEIINNITKLMGGSIETEQTEEVYSAQVSMPNYFMHSHTDDKTNKLSHG